MSERCAFVAVQLHSSPFREIQSRWSCDRSTSSGVQKLAFDCWYLSKNMGYLQAKQVSVTLVDSTLWRTSRASLSRVRLLMAPCSCGSRTSAAKGPFHDLGGAKQAYLTGKMVYLSGFSCNRGSTLPLVLGMSASPLQLSNDGVSVDDVSQHTCLCLSCGAVRSTGGSSSTTCAVSGAVLLLLGDTALPIELSICQDG